MVYPTLHSSAFPALRPSPGTRHYSVAWQPKPVGREVLACATDKGGKIWDMERGGTGVKKFGINVQMRELVWSRDGLFFATGGDEAIDVWKSDGFKLVSLQLVPQVKKYRLGPGSMKFNDSGRLLAVCESGLFDSVIHIFDALAGVCLQTVAVKDVVNGYAPLVWRNEVEFYYGEYETITHHKVGQDGPVQVLSSRYAVNGLAFNRENGILASTGAGRRGVELWNPPQHSPDFINTVQPVMEVMWSPQNATVLAARLSLGGVQILDTARKTSLLHILEGAIPTTIHSDASFSPNGRFLAVGDDRVSVWNVSTGEMVAMCEFEARQPVQGKPVKVSWSPNGDKLAVNVDANSVSVFNLENIVTMNLKTLSMMRVAEYLKMNNNNSRDVVDKLFREKGVPQKLVKEINPYLE